MRRIRAIPVLLLDQGALVKTRAFRRPRYLGDPINAVRIFNEKRVDELMLLDISTWAGRAPEVDRLADIVSEAFMPVAYGGGISSIPLAADLLARGIEKLVLNTAVWKQPALVEQLAARFGSQAVVASIDARRNVFGQWRARVRGGRVATGLTPASLARRAVDLGAGEILLTAIDREGTRRGFDLELCRSVSAAVDVPVVAHGGAGDLTDFRRAILEGGCSAVAAGSMFVFAAEGGGVLISYPSEADLEEQFWRCVA